MVAPLLESSILFLSSLLSFALIYYKVSITTLPQIVVETIIILIIILDRFVLKNSRPLNFALRLFLLFLLSLSLQVLVLSTGGFYSPFLVLFHLFAITLSFLVNLRVASSFLILSVSALIVATLLDERLFTVLNRDFGSVVLYLISFMAIIPLSGVVASRYHLKDTLSKILTQELKLTKIRQKSILEGLSDMVIITNTDLKILSFNEAAQRGLRLSTSELVDRPLFEVLILKDLKNLLVDKEYLSIAEILQDKTIRTVKNLLLYVRNTSLPKRVNVQIRPTVNLEGKIDQIAFIISDAATGGQIKGVPHQDLQEALLKHEAALEDLKNDLLSKGMVDLGRKAKLFGKTGKDILIATEFQDHGLRLVVELKDIAQILPRIVSVETLFARALGVNLSFKIDDKYTKEAAGLIPKDSRLSPSIITSPYFTVPIDSKWFDLLIQNLLEVVILLVSGTKSPQIQLFLTYDKEFVYLIFTTHSNLVAGDDRLLFTEYYGRLSTTTNLRLGSGLEGYMAKTVASLLGIPLDVQINDQSSLEFRLKLSKKPVVS